MESQLPSGLKSVCLENGETYSYREAGSSDKVLILIHGNLVTSLFFELFISKISSHVRVIAPDLRGYGYSSYKTPIDKVEDFCEDLKQFMEKLQIPKCSILGWSAGGMTAQLFAAMHPEMVEELILVGTVGPRGTMMKDDTGKILKEKESFKKTWRLIDLDTMVKMGNKTSIKHFLCYAAFQNKELPEEEALLRYAVDIARQKNLFDVLYAFNAFNISAETNGNCVGSNQIKDISCRTLLIHGNQDDNVACYNAWEVKKALGKKAEIEIIDGRHFLFEVQCVDNVVKLVVKFLSEGAQEAPSEGAPQPQPLKVCDLM